MNSVPPTRSSHDEEEEEIKVEADSEEDEIKVEADSAWIRRRLSGSVYLWAFGEKANDEDDDVKLSDAVIGWAILFVSKQVTEATEVLTVYGRWAANFSGLTTGRCP